MLRSDTWNCWQSGWPNVHPSTCQPLPSISLLSKFPRNTDSIMTVQKEDYRRKKIWMKLVLSFQLHPSISTPWHPSTSENEVSGWIIHRLFLIYSTVYYNQVRSREHSQKKFLPFKQLCLCATAHEQTYPAASRKQPQWCSLIAEQPDTSFETKWKCSNCYAYIE